MIHARVRWAASQRGLDALNGLCVAFDERFELAVRPVAYPPVHALRLSGRLCEHPEADPLHTAGDHVATGDEH